MHGRVDLLDQLFWHIALGPRAASATKRFKCSSATTLIGGRCIPEGTCNRTQLHAPDGLLEWQF
jgi:hypothetical protein